MGEVAEEKQKMVGNAEGMGRSGSVAEEAEVGDSGGDEDGRWDRGSLKRGGRRGVRAIGIKSRPGCKGRYGMDCRGRRRRRRRGMVGITERIGRSGPAVEGAETGDSQERGGGGGGRWSGSEKLGIGGVWCGARATGGLVPGGRGRVRGSR
ncbi:hypothetical protein CBR_g4516 [Chara braunii]|uniref:Uncharacterized protein n=1 Tax=Chara braunii TaxID=69332 RepID=A0A388KI32_CHABU|nr:hypothetical protein CBR_g4516 [Chara braunii]|eukprot:GBG69686.1 hypothetical protein CBR_g4516 [Chara braunii]